MAKQRCTYCEGNGMTGPLDDPDYCFHCHGEGRYEDGCDAEDVALVKCPSALKVGDRVMVLAKHSITGSTLAEVMGFHSANGWPLLHLNRTPQINCDTFWSPTAFAQLPYPKEG